MASLVGAAPVFRARWNTVNVQLPQPIDPDVVMFEIVKPDATSTTYTFGSSDIVRESKGVYSLRITVDMAGAWKVIARSTGAGQAVRSIELRVLAA